MSLETAILLKHPSMHSNKITNILQVVNHKMKIKKNPAHLFYIFLVLHFRLHTLQHTIHFNDVCNMYYLNSHPVYVRIIINSICIQIKVSRMISYYLLKITYSIEVLKMQSSIISCRHPIIYIQGTSFAIFSLATEVPRSWPFR